MPIYCATGAVWLMRPGGSKIRPTTSTWSSVPLGLTASAGANCDRRPPSLRASNSRAFAFVTSASPCLLPSKSAGPLLLSRSLCPDGFFPGVVGIGTGDPVFRSPPAHLEPSEGQADSLDAHLVLGQAQFLA